MRLFIAVPISETIRADVGALIDDLKRSGADVKWVKPTNLHLTLSFLGEVGKEKIPALQNIVARTADENGSFELKFDRLGAFGAPSRPRVLWMGIGSGAKALSEIAARLKAALGSTGLAPAADHEFSPHLTLGRVRGPRGIKSLVERFMAAKLPAGLSCRVERLVLFQSRLDGQGLTYKALFESPLQSLFD